MRKMIRFSALLLMLCMVVSLLPVSAFAATQISVITITGLDEPVANKAPDYSCNVTSTPANAIAASRVDWYCYDALTGEPEAIAEGDPVKVGDVVYALVQLYANEGYEFPSESGYYTGAVNMQNYDNDYPAQVVYTDVAIVFTTDFYIVTDMEGEQITAVTVSDLDMPIAGETPDFEATVTTTPADAVGVYEIVWAMYDEATDGAILLDETHVFAENELVAALLCVAPAEGYIFGEPLTAYTGTVTTPYMEDAVIYDVNADGSMYIYAGEWYVPSVTVGKFVDVPADEWFTEAVAWAVENGVTTGVDEYHFEPDEGCTRAQAVTFLWRAAGKPEPTLTECGFVDVDVNEYYYKAVLWAVENGITTGTDETHFEPEEVCTRSHIVTFLYRALKGTVSETATNPFVDVPADTWCAEAVLWAAENGVTTGTDETHFEPESTCTRSQIVTFIYRAMAE